MGVHQALELLAIPGLAVMLPELADARERSALVFNELVAEGLMTPAGETTGKCSKCQSRKLLMRYRPVYRMFFHVCLQLGTRPGGLDPLKAFYGATTLLMLDPDTQKPHYL